MMKRDMHKMNTNNQQHMIQADLRVKPGCFCPCLVLESESQRIEEPPETRKQITKSDFHSSPGALLVNRGKEINTLTKWFVCFASVRRCWSSLRTWWRTGTSIIRTGDWRPSCVRATSSRRQSKVGHAALFWQLPASAVTHTLWNQFCYQPRMLWSAVFCIRQFIECPHRAEFFFAS